MLSQYNLRGAIHVCVVKRIPLALAIAFLLFALPAFGAETRGVKHTTLIKESVTGRYLALLIGTTTTGTGPSSRRRCGVVLPPVPR